MAYQDLSLSGFIKEAKDASEGKHRRKFCFIIGAGASVTSGIPSGKDLVDIWDKEILNRYPREYEIWKENLKITDENKYSHYSDYYTKRYSRNPIEGQNYLTKLMDKATPHLGYIMLAYIMSHEKTPNNVVITTNFDHLIEDAVSYYSHDMALVVGHESLAHYITPDPKGATIIKVHRDILLDPVNTDSENDDFMSKWDKALKIIFSEYHPVIIGYAGNDNSLMEYLVKNADKFGCDTDKIARGGTFKCPYWMRYKDEAIEGSVKDFIDKSGAYLVRHEGFDEVLHALGVAFDYKLPEEENFLKDARDRYNKLTNAINEMNSKQSMPKSYESKEFSSAHDMSQERERTSEKKKSIYETLLESDPNNARYRSLCGLELYNKKQYEDAIIHEKKAVELEPDNAQYHDNLSTTLHELKRYDEALIETQKAVELEPDNARYHYSLSATLHALKRYDEALIEAQKAIELKPNIVNYQYNLGATLYRMKRFTESLNSLENAISLSSKIDRAYIYRALTKLHLSLTDPSFSRLDAFKDFATAIEKGADDARNYRDRAEGYLLIDMFPEAEADLDKAQEMDESDPEIFYLYSVLYEKQGDSERAKEAYEKALSLGYIPEPTEP